MRSTGDNSLEAAIAKLNRKACFAATVGFLVGCLYVPLALAQDIFSYFLPKSVISFSIIEDTKSSYAISTMKVKAVADPEYQFTFEYIIGDASLNNIQFQKNGSNILERIGVSPPHASQQILEELTIAIQNSDIAIDRPAFENSLRKLARFEFDPLDPVDLRSVNRNMKNFGFCIVPLGFSSRPDLPNLTETGVSCGSDTSSRNGATNEKSHLPKQSELKPGIYYRAKDNFDLAVFQNSSKRIQAPDWKLNSIARIQLLDPTLLFSIDVNRALAFNGNFSLRFNDGVLNDIELAQNTKSERVLDIPIHVASEIVNLPPAMVTIHANKPGAKEALIEAQKHLVEAIKTFREHKKLAPN